MERGADLHMAQLMPLPLTVSCFSKIQIVFTFLVPAHPGSPGQRAACTSSVSLQFLKGPTLKLKLKYRRSLTDMCPLNVTFRYEFVGLILAELFKGGRACNSRSGLDCWC